MVEDAPAVQAVPKSNLLTPDPGPTLVSGRTHAEAAAKLNNYLDSWAAAAFDQMCAQTLVSTELPKK